MKHIHERDLLKRWQEIADLLPKFAEVNIGVDYIELILYYTLTKISQNDIIEIEKILKSQLNTETGEEIMGSIVDHWLQEGRQEGIQEGIHIGEMKLKEEKIIIAKNLIKAGLKTDLIVTSTGLKRTESNNLIMKNFYDGDIFISAIEHLSIYNHINYTPNIKIIRVNTQGLVDLEHLEELLSQSNVTKKLVSVMMANNESGVLQDTAEISKITKKYDARFHSDLVQVLGKISINIKELGLDFATISGHKIGAGQGSSSLISNSNFQVAPMSIGGGQEKGVRSGTENVLAIAGFGLAAELVTKDISEKYIKIKNLQEILEKKLREYANVNIISENALRLPNTTLFTVPKTDAQIKLIAFDLRNICVSSGSACSSGKISKSHVLTNMGMSEKEVKSSIRVSLSHNNTKQDIEAFIEAFEEVYDVIPAKAGI